MADEWYCKIIGQEVGPIPLSDIADLLLRGQLAPDDPVREGASGEWVTAGSVAGVSEDALPKQNGRPAGDRNGELDTERLLLRFTRALERFEALIDRMERAGVAPAGTAAAPGATPATGGVAQDEPEAEAPVSASDLPPEDWYCEVGGLELGPLELDELVAMASNQQLGREDRIRHGQDGEWIVAGSLPGVFPEFAGAEGPGLPLQPPPQFAVSESAASESGEETRGETSETGSGHSTTATRSAADDIIRNLAANTIRRPAPTSTARGGGAARSMRGGPSRLSGSRGGEERSLLDSLGSLKRFANGKAGVIAGGAVVLLLVVYLIYSSMLTARYREVYPQVEALHADLESAREQLGPEQLKVFYADFDKRRAELLEQVEGASTGSAGGRLAGALRELEALGNPDTDEKVKETAELTYLEYMKRAKKALGIE